MTRRLAELLAETDDVDAIEDLLELATSNSSNGDSGEPRDLGELYQRFLSRRQDRSPGTRAQYKRTIPDFIDFSARRGIRMTTGLSTDLVDAYVDELQATHEADATILTYTKNVRGWLAWLNKRGHCPESVYRILDKDELGLTPTARDEAIQTAIAESLLEVLSSRRKGSLEHALLALLWNAGPRIGAVHSSDVQDFDADRNEIRFRHRPERGTRLKNGSQSESHGGDGERNVLLSDFASRAIQSYLRYERPSVTDEFDREPLFATQYGRASQSTLRRAIYRATSCRWHSSEQSGQTCHGNCDPDSDVCPYSYYPHAIRRGAIVHHLSGGLRIDLASDRFDVSIQTLRKHYDPRSKERRRRDRADSVRDAW
jgi:site-specific recombinase XerD